MRNFPIDTDRVRLISTGTVTPVSKWVELADGTRRPDPNGRQDVTEDGRPLWRVEVIAPGDEDDDRDKTSVIEVTVASHDEPSPGTFGELVAFEGLTVSPGYLNRKTGQLTQPRWTAEGLRAQSGGRKQRQTPQHEGENAA